MATKTITIVQRERPYSDDLEENIMWLLASLGVSEAMLDKYARMLIQIAKTETSSASGLAEELGNPRTSLAYHINKLVDMGMLTREGRRYRLRAATFLRSVEEIERDVLRMFEDLKKVARVIDEQLGLPRR